MLRQVTKRLSFLFWCILQLRLHSFVQTLSHAFSNTTHILLIHICTNKYILHLICKIKYTTRVKLWNSFLKKEASHERPANLNPFMAVAHVFRCQQVADSLDMIGYFDELISPAPTLNLLNIFESPAAMTRSLLVSCFFGWQGVDADPVVDDGVMGLVGRQIAKVASSVVTEA